MKIAASRRWRAIRLQRWPLAVAVLCVGLALATALRLGDMHLKRGMGHDEAISYLAAAGHEDEYSLTVVGEGLAGRWVTAAQWKSMMVPDGFWGYGRITTGLNHTDNHPPLYFWVLHAWVWLVGLHLWTGPLLNLILAVTTGVFVFVLGRRVLGDARYAALAAVVWACSYPVVVTSRMARHYDVFALFAVLFVLVSLRLADRDTRLRVGDIIALAVLTAACFLTHYEFAAFAAGTVVLFALSLWRNRRRLLTVLGAMAAGVLLAIALNPGLLQSFTSQRAQAHGGTLRLFVQRVDSVRLALQSFFHYTVPGPEAGFTMHGTAHSGKYVCLATFAVLLGLGVAVLLPGVRSRLLRRLRTVRRETWVFLAFLGVAAATTLLPYLMFQVPAFATGGRYLAILWPLLALAVMLAFKALGRAGVAMAVLLTLWIVVPAAYLVVVRAPAGVQLEPFPANARVLVVNTVARGRLLPVIWRVPDDVAVYADAPDSLLSKPDAWLPRLLPGSCYASVSAPLKSVPNWRAPLTLLRTTRALVGDGMDIWWAKGRLWEVLRVLPSAGT